ncbi:MAG: glycoside hydrolase family 97 catalytic domain-containing protein, partial [Bacteroidales bacterium]|nr:glycoside hydrolase family 97 catalytic domain-containing protein [Bacteroidales bacterium]
MYRKHALCLIFTILPGLSAEAREYAMKSPDSNIIVIANIDKTISYSIQYKGTTILEPSSVSMNFQPGIRTSYKKIVRKVFHRSVNNNIIPPVREKRAVIPDIYNEMIISFTDNTELHFRAYNDGVAYRFAVRASGEITVESEKAEFNITDGTVVWYPQVAKRQDADIFHTAFEEPYSISSIDTIPADMFAFNPLLLCKEGLPKIVITESDVKDYPGMFLAKGQASALKGVFAPYPVKEVISGVEFRQKLVVERAPYIARTKGPRTFPWRVVVVAEKDEDLLVNDIVYRLASAPVTSDFSWIRPGKSTEEWITGLNLYGVDFKAGLNTATYKYYIDFASEFGFEYVMLDAGWSDVNDLFKINPDMDMEEITGYAEKKGVGLILWTQALTIEGQMEQAFQQFKKWGIKIVMTDFIDRDDQPAINFMHWFAEECAKAGFLCVIHGAPKPAGFSRTYPNMLTREGVLGSEYNIWSSKANPEHDL